MIMRINRSDLKRTYLIYYFCQLNQLLLLLLFYSQRNFKLYCSIFQKITKTTEKKNEQKIINRVEKMPYYMP